MMARTLGFGPDGMGALLSGAIASCREIRAALAAAVPDLRPLEPMDTNIFCFSVAPIGAALSEANARTAAAHRALSASPHISMTRTVIGADAARDLIAEHVRSYGGVFDADHLVLVRCVVMNPFWASADVRARLLPELTAELGAIVAATETRTSVA
jgi:hypothetical protein